MDPTPFEFSENGEFAIHSSYDGVVKVWESATNTLKNEYKPSSHLSASCSCLSWCPSSKVERVEIEMQVIENMRFINFESLSISLCNYFHVHEGIIILLIIYLHNQEAVLYEDALLSIGVSEVHKFDVFMKY